MLLQELQTGKFMLGGSNSQLLAGTYLKLAIEEATKECLNGNNGGPCDKDKDEKSNIVILPIDGVMRKYDGWFTEGMDSYADYIRELENDPEVDGYILKFNTPGGNTQALIQIEDALRNRKKPCVALIDGMCCSCGIYVASLCDKIYAMNRMCEVGSIGCYVQLINTDKMYEEWGVKIIDIYPPESSYKNKPVREALNGNPQLLIDEELSPFAQHFQNIIRERRKKLDESVEGILEGKVFYAYDAVNNGLIDGIGNMETCIDYIVKKKELSNKLNTLFR